MPAGEQMQIDTSPSSEMEILSEVGFLKRNKVAGPGELLSNFFKDGGEVSLSELTTPGITLDAGRDS